MSGLSVCIATTGLSPIFDSEIAANTPPAVSRTAAQTANAISGPRLFRGGAGYIGGGANGANVGLYASAIFGASLRLAPQSGQYFAPGVTALPHCPQ
jgi:hypothetical protein